MIKRTVEISQKPVHIAVRNGQIILKPRADDDANPVSIPAEDIGMLLLDHPATTLSQQALSKLAESGASVVVCGRDHLPAAIMLPVSHNTEVAKRLRLQISPAINLRKRLWKQIVVAKILQQAKNLQPASPAERRLRNLATEVKSGDPSNSEAQAAKVYWKTLWGPFANKLETPFRRDPDGAWPNSFLNYGYMVMRAAVARALVSAGLHPTLGIHHVNQSNAFCLADDFVEPFRPLVDRTVCKLVDAGHRELTQPAKATLLELLTFHMTYGDQSGPLMVSLHAMAASYVACLEGKEKLLTIPVPKMSSVT